MILEPAAMEISCLDLDDFSILDGVPVVPATAFSSPGMSSRYEPTGSASSSVTNVGTVSPHDLLVHEPYMSAPNSSALTALTSPSMYDGSPDERSIQYVAWFWRFEPTSVTTPENESVTQEVNLKKQKSGASPTGRHSLIAGVNARRREKPLPPIVVDDPSDVIAMKRARNTLAARKSRERKAQRLEELEERIAKLEQERDYWKGMAEDRQASS
ncbi:unnamed protein product [Parascedosporium putredinis]|uniref:Cross-pathway control protein 1 n=1 Tax=Parascedosporium putredinis TaxID=1442378 RepID=A0A9P1HC79_9PEZI|nr:unnamed protein product [Parascedosporium putredinis]CAI8004482.1 unnamed protein product [Parascedosporium putredinis]